MKDRSVRITRTTKETDITLELDLDKAGPQEFDTELPFLSHMLHAMAFHGGFLLKVKGKGDMDVDPHHLVEDVGLVLGQALSEALEKGGPVCRYGHSVIPMDDALSRTVVDVCRRPYLVYQVDFPQSHIGPLDLCLMREFFQALANSARINLHVACLYGHNSHHMIESLFKSLGRAIKEAWTPLGGGEALSTKGSL